MSWVFRPFIAAILGAALGAGALAAAYARDPGLTFEMNAELPAFFSGMHAPERAGELSFAWTTDRVTIDLADLHRTSPWSCSIRFRGPRPEGLPAPVVDVIVDTARVASVPAAADFHDLGFTVPAGKSSLHLAINVAPAFTPGTADKRLLGVQLDRFQCRPSGTARPPGWPMMQMAFASAFVAGVFVVIGVPLTGALLSAAVVSIGAAAMLTTGGAVYSHFSNTTANLAVWITLLISALMTSAEKVAGRRFTGAARAVFVISAVALMLKLFGLLHPAKPDIDALFHAHRLNDVIGGRYYFTQPFVGGVQMPYPIGLYVFAWPWTWLVSDHVAIVRVVTAASDVVAGMLLYPVVVRLWGNRRAGVLAVLCYQLAPLPFAMLGNANLTNIFGQSVALAAIAAAAVWNLDVRRPLSLVGFTALVTWAFCSHVSTITMLLATLGAMVVLYWWRGDGSRRSAAVGIVVGSAVALVASWVVYYRHLSEEIREAFSRMFSGGTGVNAATAEEAARGFLSFPERVGNLLAQAQGSVGWPIVLLAGIGIWSLGRRGIRDRLVAAVMAWAAMWLVFSASTVFSQVAPEFVRYTIEFLGRINLAALPMFAILAAMGASAGWDEATPSAVRSPLRAISVVLVAWSGWIAWNALIGWFSR